jgi:hypothetical protein
MLPNHKPTPVQWIKKFFYCRKNGKIGYVSHFFRQGTLRLRFYLKIQDRDFVKNGFSSFIGSYCLYVQSHTCSGTAITNL